MSDNQQNPNQSNDKFWAIGLSIGVALSLTLIKLTVGFITHSLAVLASAMDSFMDVLVSTVNLISLREAEKPADKEHLYGHGKIESIAGLFQSLVIALSGIYLVYESIRRLITGSEIDYIPSAIGVMVVSMIVTLFLVTRLERVSKETESIIVKTETLHYVTDILANGGVILALVLVSVTESALWDLIVAFVIAIWIVKQAFLILKKSIDELLDRSLPVEEQKEIEQIILNHDSRIVGFHNLRTRKIGHQRFIDFHFEIRGEESFKEAHNLTESLVRQIQGCFPGADVTIHYDPEGAD